MTTFNLRRYTLEDAKARHEAIFESTDQLLPWTPYAKNCTYEDCYQFVQFAEEAWKNGKDYCFVIEDQDHQFVGEAQLMDVSKDYYQNKAMIAGWVRQSRVRQGATTYAWQALVKFQDYSQWNPFITEISGELKLGATLNVLITPPNKKGMRFKPTQV